MNLNKLKKCIARYKSFLQSEKNDRFLYVWESLNYFQDNWKTEASDLAEMYDRSLNNTTSRRQWKKEDFFPKEMMLKFIKTEPEYVRLAFRDLFNEDKSLSGRVDRFGYYCEELLKIYLEKNPKGKENDHYHTPEFIMLYVAYRFPEKYTLYDSKSFNYFLEDVEAKNVLAGHDLGRYAKLTKTVNTFLQKDEEIISLIKNRLEDKHYQGINFLSVYEMMLLNKY